MVAVPVPLPGAVGEVDRCPDCDAVFFDFEDGEPRELARCMPEIGAPRGGVALRADPVCPACHAPLVVAAYLGRGPEVLRCGECAGLAARWEEVEALARALDEPDTAVKPPWLRRLAAALGLLKSRRSAP
jgi:Zn-finger nucleic acid-binding protein